MSEGPKAERKDSKATKRHGSRPRSRTASLTTSKRRKTSKRHGAELSATPSPSATSETSLLSPSSAPTPRQEATSTISLEFGDDVAGARSGGSSPAVAKALAEGATTTRTRDFAAGQWRKTSGVMKDEKLTSTPPAVLVADIHESSGIEHTATDPDMAAAIAIREVDVSENAQDVERPLFGYAAAEKSNSLVALSSSGAPPPELQSPGADQDNPTRMPPKRKSRGQSTVTFGDARSYRLTADEPSTSEILGQGSHQLRILACAQLSIGALAFHYQSMRLLAPAAVDHWCRQPAEFAYQSVQAWKNASIPVGLDGRYSRCTVYRFPYSHGVAVTSGPTPFSSMLAGVADLSRDELPCHDWDYDVPTGVLTALNEWDLVCSNAWLVLAARIYTYLGGVVCTSFLGKMADNMGRRPVLLACAVVAVAASALTVFAGSFVQLVLLRMLVAASLSGFSVVSIVLLFEVTYEASRTDYICGVIIAYVICGWIPCLLGAAALVIDRRTLAFAFLVPVSLLLTSFQVVRESSRWLLVIGDVTDFVDRLYAAAASRGRRSEVDLDRTAIWRLQNAARPVAAAAALGRRPTDASLQPASSAAGTIVLPGLWIRTASLSALFLSLFVVLNETSRCGGPQESHASLGAPPLSAEALPSLSLWQTAVLVVPRTVSVLLAARLLQRCERKKALMLGLPLSCAALALLALVEPAISRGGYIVYVVVVAGEVVMASVLVNLAFACVYCLELYSTAERAAGFAVVYSVGFLGGVAVMRLFDGQDPAVRKMCGLALAVVALLQVDHLPETKGARLPDAANDAISQLKRYSMSSASKSFGERRPSADYGYPQPDGK